MANIFPIDFEEKLTMAQDDYILFSDSEDGNKIKKAQYKNLKGEKGDPGTPGQDGEDGAAATITVGSVSTGAAGSSATVVNSGTSSAAVLDFTIPQGVAGTPGAAATITVGTTTTLPAGSSATVTNVGTSTAAVFDFGIPQGTPGTGSGDVSGPNSSTDGHLAVFDGTTGKKIKDGGAMPTIPTKVSDLSNDSGFITGINSGDVTTALGYTPADSASLGTAASKNTGTSSGNVPVLDSNGKLATSTLPGVALTDTFTVSTSSDLTSLSSADQGDIAIVTSENKTYVLSVAPYSTAANWKEILAPTGGVTSVNGQTGAVTVPVGDVVGPASATDGHLVLFDGNTGKLIKDGGSVPTGVPSGGTDGQVLSKVSGNIAWANPTGGIQLAPNTELNIKYHRYGSQASYDSLNQYYTDTAGDTAYFTI